ncbi:4Fe-4S dicluster domain-containing protein [bacterium]|nr:4Fe-4S dicluster domain-containing protein [bacterium]
MSSFAILTDVTRCTGCEECVLACKVTHETGLRDAPHKWQGAATDLSSTRWTTIAKTEGRNVRVHCRHCLEPGCAAACPVGALHTTDEGAVAYDATICLGCRYCMVACPFSMTRYEWESTNPRVRKCILCYEKIGSGELKQPACTGACPEDATIFGERDALLAEAKKRIADHPDRYLDHVWGEEEVGGTSVLYISDVDLVKAGWPASLPGGAVPELADMVLHTVPATFVSVGVAMAGIHWVIKRRQKLAAETAILTDAETPAIEDKESTTDGEQS